MELKGGSRTDYGDSLAEAIEAALDAVRIEHGLDELPDEGRADRQMLFMAIGRGIVTYLAKHETAFVVRRHSSGAARHTHMTDGYVEIKTA